MSMRLSVPAVRERAAERRHPTDRRSVSPPRRRFDIQSCFRPALLSRWRVFQTQPHGVFAGGAVQHARGDAELTHRPQRRVRGLTHRRDDGGCDGGGGGGGGGGGERLHVRFQQLRGHRCCTRHRRHGGHHGTTTRPFGGGSHYCWVCRARLVCTLGYHQLPQGRFTLSGTKLALPVVSGLGPSRGRCAPAAQQEQPEHAAPPQHPQRRPPPPLYIRRQVASCTLTPWARGGGGGGSTTHS
jgi:hypothetical protein